MVERTRRRLTKAPWKFFPAREQAETLGIDEKFEASLTPQTRILEVGSGSGRLAEHLLNSTHANPQNYTLFDQAYVKPSGLKRGIFKRWKQGKIKLAEGDYYKHDFGNAKWRHILFPHAFFSRDGWKRFSDLTHVIRKFSKHLEPGGSLRVSSVVLPEAATYARNLRGGSGIPPYMARFQRFLDGLEKKGFTARFVRPSPRSALGGIVVENRNEK